MAEPTREHRTKAFVIVESARGYSAPKGCMSVVEQSVMAGGLCDQMCRCDEQEDYDSWKYGDDYGEDDWLGGDRG